MNYKDVAPLALMKVVRVPQAGEGFSLAGVRTDENTNCLCLGAGTLNGGGFVKIPTGFNHSARGCEEGATPGTVIKIKYPNGVSSNRRAK